MPGNLPGLLHGRLCHFLILVYLCVYSYALDNNGVGPSADTSCMCSLPLNQNDNTGVYNDPPCKYPYSFNLKNMQSTPANPAITQGLIHNIKQISLKKGKSSFRCIDSRENHFSSHRTWGGDFLEFLRVQSFAKKHYKQVVNQNQVDRFVYTWMDELDMEFHYSTDQDALNRIVVQQKEQYNVSGDQLINLLQPSRLLEPYLYKILGLPLAHGNAALRVGLELGDTVDIDTAILPLQSRSVFRLLWHKQYIGVHGVIHTRLHINVNQGLHEPKAYIDVYDNKDCKTRGYHSTVSIGYHQDINKKSSLLETNTTVESVFDTNGAAWIEVSAEEELQGTEEANAFRTAPDEEIQMFLQSNGVDIDTQRNMSDADEHSIQVLNSMVEQLLRTSLNQEQSSILNTLTSILGQEYITERTNALLQKDDNIVLLEQTKLATKTSSIKQDKMQILIMSQDAVQTYRKQLLTHLNTIQSFGNVNTIWKQYQAIANKHDQVFKKVFAKNLPQYALYIE